MPTFSLLHCHCGCTAFTHLAYTRHASCRAHCSANLGAMTSPATVRDRFRIRAAGVSWRDIDGEVVALDIGTGDYLRFNGSGRVLWLALVEPVSAEELGALLAETFAITPEQGWADAQDFVGDLTGRELVEVVP
jgi:hypothetical protein